MATITRTPMVDDDGSGTTGTILNNAWQTGLYNAMDAAYAAAGSWPGGVTGNLSFPATQVPSTNANTLDDYEEGSWTPTITGSTGGSGQTYSAQSGSYIKIGRLVIATWDVTLSAKGTINGGLQIGGLPMNAAAPMSGPCIGYFDNLAINISMMSGYVIVSSIQLYYTLAAGSPSTTSMLGTDLNNNTRISGTMMYFASQ